MARFEKTGCLRHASRFAHGSLYNGGGVDICQTTEPLSDSAPKSFVVKRLTGASVLWLKLEA